MFLSKSEIWKRKFKKERYYVTMMESNFAKWLDVTFAGFDGALLEFYHRLAEWGGVVLTPFMRVITVMGDKAWR